MPDSRVSPQVRRVESQLALLSRGTTVQRLTAARGLRTDLAELQHVLSQRSSYVCGDLDLQLLGESAIPNLVEMLLAQKANAGDSQYSRCSRALFRFACTCPSLLRPHQQAFEEIVLELSAESYNFYQHYARHVGTCLGVCGESASEFIASRLTQHAGDLPAKPYHDRISLRLHALIEAAKYCPTPQMERALFSVLDNVHARGPAFVALYERRYPTLLCEMHRVLPAGHVLGVLNRMLLEPAESHAPLVVPHASILADLVKLPGAADAFRSTALMVLGRFLPREQVMPLLLEQAGSDSDVMREAAVLVAFSADGLPFSRRLQKGGGVFQFPPDSGLSHKAGRTTGAKSTHADQDLASLTGEGLGADHLTVCERVLSHGPSLSATMLLGLLGDGVQLPLRNLLRCEGITGQQCGDDVTFAPVSLIGTLPSVMSKIATCVQNFLVRNEWPHHDRLYHDKERGAVCGVSALVRLREVDRLRDLSSRSDTLRHLVLSQAPSLARELADVYISALQESSRQALWHLIKALPNPDAGAIILRYGLEVFRLVMKDANTCSGACTGDALRAMTERDPALAQKVFDAVLARTTWQELGDGYDIISLQRCLDSFKSPQRA